MNLRAPLAAVAVALVLAGCAGQDRSGSADQQMRSWVNGTNLGATIGTLVGDVQHAASQLHGGGSAAALHTVCGVLLVDTEQANSNLPTPDQSLTTLLSNAYETLGEAGHDCYDAVGNPAKSQAFDAAKAKGLLLLSEAQSRAESILGSVIVTTTTVPLSGGGGF